MNQTKSMHFIKVVSATFPYFLLTVSILLAVGELYLAAFCLMFGSLLGYLDRRLVEFVDANDKELAGYRTLVLNEEEYQAVKKLLAIAGVGADDETKF